MNRSRVGPTFLPDVPDLLVRFLPRYPQPVSAEGVRNVFGRIRCDPALDPGTIMLLGDLSPEEVFEVNAGNMTTEQAVQRMVERSAVLTDIRET